MNNNLISVIITNRNRKYETVRALKSIYNQSVLPYEVIVVDDGSTDGSQQYIKNQIDCNYKYVFIEDIPNNVGNARNTGIKVAAGRWISFLDSDDVWHVDRIKNLIDSINTNFDADIIVSDYYRHYKSEINRIMQYDSNQGFFINGNSAASFTVYNKEIFYQMGTFPLDCGWATDWIWILKAYSKSKLKICVTEGIAGEQWLLQDSLSGDINKTVDEYIDVFKMLNIDNPNLKYFFLKGYLERFRLDKNRAELLSMFEKQYNLENIENLLEQTDIRRLQNERKELTRKMECQRSFYQLMVAWIQLKQDGKRIDEILKKKGISVIAIYGAGKHGKILAKEFDDADVKLAYFIDQNEKAASINGVHVILPHMVDNTIDAIIVSVYQEFISIEQIMSKFSSAICIPLDELIMRC